MRVKYKGLVIACDWAVHHENKIVFGTRSKEIFYTEFGSEETALRIVCDLSCHIGYVLAENFGVVQNCHIDEMSDLLCDDVFEDAVFEPFPGGKLNGRYI